ncbi:MAG: AAA family ATPase [Bacteroidetes bacterium]|nr:AAA family ATPase [Bacteroidota bacterium]
MNQLRLILVSGLPGSGKSFFAEKLAGKIGAIYLNSDYIRSAIHLRGKYTTSDKAAVYKEMYKQTSNYLQEKKSVVVDATFQLAATRDLFLNLAEEKYISVFCFEVWADEDLIRQRLSQKRVESEADFKIYMVIKEQFEAWTTPRLKLQSTQENISAMLEEAIEYIEGENV